MPPVQPETPPSPAPVLHVCAGNLFGGVESFLLTLHDFRTFSRRFRHEFAICFPGRLRESLEQRGAPVHELPAVRLSRPWQWLQARHRLRQLIHRIQPALVVIHSDWTRAAFGGALTTDGTPLVAWVHGVGSNPHWLARFASGPGPCRLVTNSQHTAGLLRGSPGSCPLEVLHYPVAPPAGLDAAERARTRTGFGARPDEVVIALAARLDPWKGHGILIDALARVRTRTPWTCWIAGGPQVPEEHARMEGLRGKVREAGLENRIRFLGQRGDVPRLLASADLYCQPNTDPEPFGIVFVEALYAGLPVISSAFGGAAEIVDSTCGRLVPPGDPEALGRALDALIGDPALRQALAARAPERAASLCHPSHRIPAIEEALLRAAGAGGR